MTLRALGEKGEELAPAAQVTLAENSSREVDIAEIFDFGELPVVGSLQLETDGDGIAGDVLFGNRSLTYAAALPLQSEAFSEAVFNQVANTADIFTGLAFFNPGSDPAEVTL